MLSSVFLAASLAAAPLNPSAATASRLGDARAHVRLDGQGQLRSAQGTLGFLSPGDRASGAAFVQSRMPALGLRSDDAVDVISDEVDALGNRHLRASRAVRGIPVDFDQVRVHAGPSGVVYAMEAELSKLDALPALAPSLSEDRARSIALGGFKGRTLEAARAQLVILGSSFPGIDAPHLTYRVRASFPARPGKVPVVEDVYVDAHSGHVVARLPRVYTASASTLSIPSLSGANVTVNVAQDSGKIALVDLVSLTNHGLIYTVDGQNNGSTYVTNGTTFSDSLNVTGEPGSVAYNVQTSVKFYKEVFNWTNWDFSKSPNGPGGLLVGIAHEGNKLNNAYFATLTSNGQVFGSMHYGDGDNNYLTNTARCLDVSGHELGHGVVQGTADLQYHYQSGALNESFADVFGWILKNRGKSSGFNDYIGDECVGPALAPALRDMCNPGSVADPQPATMAEYKSLPDTEEGDHGGVHTNSGIPNHAACLARNAIGFDKVGQIWFKTLKDHLGANASFADMVNGTLTSCRELGYAQGDCDAVAHAWAQVGLVVTQTGGSCPANSTAQGSSCVCNSGYQPNSSGTGCDPVSTQSCPAHAHLDATSGYCYCDDGYQPDAAGAQCVPEGQSCPTHSHSEGGTCVCDECYQGSPGYDGSGCTLVSGCAVCTEATETGTSGTCECIPGLNRDANGQCLAPISGDCGHENYAGRCVGDTLIYCNDVKTPKAVDVIACTQYSGEYCGADPVNGGFNCELPCGNVPESGQCSADKKQGAICYQHTLQGGDCKNGCITFNLQGSTINFCNPCPSGQIPSPDGKPKADGSVNCVADTSVLGTSTGGGGGGSGGGCGSASGGSLFFALGAVGLFILRRKR